LIWRLFHHSPVDHRSQGFFLHAHRWLSPIASRINIYGFNGMVERSCRRRPSRVYCVPAAVRSRDTRIDLRQW